MLLKAFTVDINNKINSYRPTIHSNSAVIIFQKAAESSKELTQNRTKNSQKISVCTAIDAIACPSAFAAAAAGSNSYVSAAPH